jgi:hypothetical protein
MCSPSPLCGNERNEIEMKESRPVEASKTPICIAKITEAELIYLFTLKIRVRTEDNEHG